MKLAWLLLFMAPLVQAADAQYLNAADVLQTDGVLLICDNSSYFAFHADGAFRSFPRGASGRKFDGTWKKTSDNPLTVEAIAKLGWVNGFQPQGEYRRIVFVIYGGRKRAIERTDGPVSPYRELFESYFIIDELTLVAPFGK
jgi:hypothetical protein